MKLIILGNGFDLDHGLKTSWKDIFTKEAIRNIACSSATAKTLFNNECDLWNNFESVIGNFMEEWTTIFLRANNSEIQKQFFAVYKKWKIEYLEHSHNDELVFVPETYCVKGGKDALNNIKQEADSILFNDQYRIMNQLIFGIKKAQDEYNGEHKPKYEQYFCKGDYHVINYNYTSPYTDLIDYDNKCWFIHGNITNSTRRFNEFGKRQPAHHPAIQLGVYKEYGPGKDVHKDYISECNDEFLINRFREIIYSAKNIFDKSKTYQTDHYNEMKSKEWIKIIKNEKYSELVIIGHSINNRDLHELIKNCKIKEWESIKLISSFDNNSAKEKTRKHIHDIFTVKQVKIINNNKNIK